MNDSANPPYHADPKRLRDALQLAESVTGFLARLIEKDYYCSVVLRDFDKLFRGSLVFKGGTSLSKVHTAFFRLSEDLDFSLSVSPTASPSVRRKAMEPVKEHFTDLVTRLTCFQFIDQLAGHNQSRQYNARLAYRSVVTGEDEFLKVEIGLREEVLLPTVSLPARTLLTDPNTNASTMPTFEVKVLTLREAYAEKVRAALTRIDPAIRDFFDVDNAVQSGLLDPLAPDFLVLVRKKLAVTSDSVEMGNNKLDSLRGQLETQLKPVLRASDYQAFALERVMQLLVEVVTRISTS